MVCWIGSRARAGALIAAAAVALVACKRSDPAESTPSEVESEELAAKADEAEEAPEPEGDSTATITRPFLWEVSAPEGDDVGYLFGTMHMGVDAEATLPDIVWERLDGASIFAMEADLTDMSIARRLMRDDGTTLREEIGDEAWEKLVSIVGNFQASGLDRMHAGAAAMAVIAEPLPKTPPMDLVLLQRARQAELEIEYLEEASFQIDLLLRYITTDVLLQALEDYDEVVAMSEKGLAAYMAGDKDQLLEFLLDPAGWENSPEGAQEAFLDERNKAWVPQIERMLGEGTPFVAVGAGHLVGENSVVDLLRAKGYELERVIVD
jgi:uncharacterized protein